jgi:hypothetical protein
MTRAPGDAYYTPAHVAARCVRWLAPRIPSVRTIVEPSVGAGAWVRAARAAWPDAVVDRYDVSPEAAGLTLDVGPQDRSVIADWTLPTDGRRQWDLALGNPPYQDVDVHIVRCLERSLWVALLLRETVTGGQSRYRTLWRDHRPAWIGKLPDRVQWGGANPHGGVDMAGAVLVVWGPRADETQWDWISADDQPVLLQERS